MTTVQNNYFYVNSISNFASVVYSKTISVLDKHTDLIHNVGILAITTLQLLSKIFEKTPSFLPRLSKVVFDFGGVIWLNIQKKELIKANNDLKRAWHFSKRAACLVLAVKVLFKAINILLTAATFSSSVISAFGFPDTGLSILLSLRSIGLISLGYDIVVHISDYFTNQQLLSEMKKTDMTFNPQIINNLYKSSNQYREINDNLMKVDRVFRQINIYHLNELEKIEDPTLLSDKIKEILSYNQKMTRVDLSLMGLGYCAMGVCRAFPNSIIETSTRWSMSVLYTAKLIHQKLFLRTIAPNCAT